MNESFSNWLLEKLTSEGWSQNDLAKRANTSQVTVSRILNGERRPGPDFCTGVARAFRVPPETVFRRAGLLPPVPDRDESIEQILFYYDQMSKEDQSRLVKIAESLATYGERNYE